MVFSVSKRPTIFEIHQLYREKKASCLEIVRFFTNRSQEVDKKISAVDNYTTDLAEEQAKKCDELFQKYLEENKAEGFQKLIEDYPLFGIPYFTKAIILVEDQVLNANSRILEGFRAPYSATVTERMHENGAILLGIAKMDEFATGASGESSSQGPTKNPFDLSRVPGGSSSGPAAIVASGQSVFSLGTDTGGSIRQPAAFTNTVGLKPTYGLVSRYGVMAMASSFDQVGAFTNNVEDNILITSLLAGKDSKDQTSLDSQNLIENLQKLSAKIKTTRKTHKIQTTTKPLKIGLPIEFYGESIHPQIQKAVTDLQNKLKEIGHDLVEVSLPMVKHALSVYYMTMPVELAANLERYDGVRYALQQENLENSELFYSQRHNFGEEVTRRILLGTYASSAGYYDAYYNLAQKVRYLTKQDFDRVFQEVDLLLTPVTPEFPFKLGQKNDDPVSMYLSDIYTCGINPVRIPGLSVPLGFFPVEDSGQKVDLPTGVQLLGPELSEDQIFELALEIEKIINDPD